MESEISKEFKLINALYVIATPIGNLSDMSARSLETLKHVDILAAEDTRVSKKLADMAGGSPKLVSLHKFNEKETYGFIINELLKGKSVGLVSDAGTPSISDPGFILVDAALNNNIPVLSVPGPSSVTAACSISGFDCRKFTFLGFLPRKDSEITELINTLTEIKHPIVFFESPLRVRDTLNCLKKVLKDDVRICLCKEISKKFEKVIRGKIGKILSFFDNNDLLKGEWTCIIEKIEYMSNSNEDNMIERNIDEVCNFFNIKRSKAAKILASISKNSRQNIYKNS